jgi:4-nitrophenol 2-monooxygenase / 4-nitrocatechol 4-monooxygenase, reductase component
MSTERSRRLTPDEFRNVIGHFASGVTVITTSADDAPFGTTASAVTSLSLEPPSLLICMNLQSSTGQAVAKAGSFAVNILGEDHGDLAMRFASKGGDKFSGVPLTTGDHGQPLLADALASLVCRVTEQVAAGTHVVFIAEVEEATARPGAPLAYFRGKFGRLELDEDKVVYDELREKVLAPAATVGQPLDVDELAEELHVARGPVFHALSRLTGDGLVARQPDGRFVVRAIETEDIEDAYAARRAIELGAAELSVGRAQAEDVAELRRLMEETLPLVDGERFVDVDRWVHANAAFHEHMVGLAGCETLLQTYRRLGLTAIDARALQSDDRADGILLEDHRRLVEAYEAGDVEAARDVINRHVERPKALRDR